MGCFDFCSTYANSRNDTVILPLTCGGYKHPDKLPIMPDPAGSSVVRRFALRFTTIFPKTTGETTVTSHKRPNRENLETLRRGGCHVPVGGHGYGGQSGNPGLHRIVDPWRDSAICTYACYCPRPMPCLSCPPCDGICVPYCPRPMPCLSCPPCDGICVPYCPRPMPCLCTPIVRPENCEMPSCYGVGQ